MCSFFRDDGEVLVPAMITVIVPTLNAQATLPDCLTSLVSSVVGGLVRQVIVVDGGSSDRTLQIAEDSGADIVSAPACRGEQLRAGGRAARFSWLLFLHADSVLDPGWEREVAAFIEHVDTGRRDISAAAFAFALDDMGLRPRIVEVGVAIRCSLLRLPYGDQGLLISRRLYDEIGEFKPMPLMEDVDIVRRLGRRQITILRARAVTSALKFKRDGYLKRTSRNLACLGLYFACAPLPLITKLYGGAARREVVDRLS